MVHLPPGSTLLFTDYYGIRLSTAQVAKDNHSKPVLESARSTPSTSIRQPEDGLGRPFLQQKEPILRKTKQGAV